jgi:hypothetical protein
VILMGDLSDPWVGLIAESVRGAAGVVGLDCDDELPDRPFDGGRPPRIVILHRNRLGTRDARRVSGWRSQVAADDVLAIVLCVSPFVRYAEVERWHGLVDWVLPEATAPDVLPGRVTRLIEATKRARAQERTTAFHVEVASGIEALGSGVVDTCTAAGFRARLVPDLLWSDHSGRPGHAAGNERVVTIWDVPVLEQGWPEQVERRVRLTGPVITLFGFADRAVVAEAKARGASACLDVLYDGDDLIDVIDRVVHARALDSWPVPARIEAPHVLPLRSRRPGAPPSKPVGAAPFSELDREPTIS